MKNKVGRPKTLERQTIIDIAFNEYWEKGIFNVPLTNIAKLASVSRPGIYKEFENEDGLKTEVLKKYIKLSADPAHKNYDDYKNYPDHLFNHLEAIIKGGSKKLTNDPSYLNIKRPKESIGCLMERTRLDYTKLGPKAKNLVKQYTNFRKKCFIKYVINAQSEEKFKKNLDPNLTAEYILSLFNILQIYRLNGINKKTIEKNLDIALTPLLIK